MSNNNVNNLIYDLHNIAALDKYIHSDESELDEQDIKDAEEDIRFLLEEKSEVLELKIRELESDEKKCKEIADFYNKNKARFTEPARIKAAQIVVKTEAEANDIIKQLKGLSDSALFTKFAELAKAKSIDPQAKQTGGELGWMPSDQVKPFADAISKIKDGQITTKAIRSRVGYHVVLKEESQAKKQLSQSEAKPFIERVLRQQKAAKVVEQKAADLHKNAKIEYK